MTSNYTHTHDVRYAGDATDSGSPPVHEIREHGNPHDTASKCPDEEPASLLATTVHYSRSTSEQLENASVNARLPHEAARSACNIFYFQNSSGYHSLLKACNVHSTSLRTQFLYILPYLICDMFPGPRCGSKWIFWNFSVNFEFINMPNFCEVWQSATEISQCNHFQGHKWGPVILLWDVNVA